MMRFRDLVIEVEDSGGGWERIWGVVVVSESRRVLIFLMLPQSANKFMQGTMVAFS